MPNVLSNDLETAARIARLQAETFEAIGAIAKRFPVAAMGLRDRLNERTDPNAIRLVLREAEALQATIVLGLACTANGNDVPHTNLNDGRPSHEDPTGAINALVNA
jgi:hypothetical protein